MIFALIFILILFAIHSLIPTYYHKHFNEKVIKHTNHNGLLLTFDDGPDEIYTTQLLDTLKKHQIKAIFFVVAKNAQQHPQLIQRMIEEGHEIGLHSLEHKNAWLYSYFYTKKDFEESIDIMNSLGVHCPYYRPPWGHMNVFSYHFIKKHHLKLFLWNVMIQDWEGHHATELSHRLIAQSTKNSIICLHDASNDSIAVKGAPLQTIEALDQSIPQLKINLLL